MHLTELFVLKFIVCLLRILNAFVSVNNKLPLFTTPWLAILGKLISLNKVSYFLALLIRHISLPTFP